MKTLVIVAHPNLQESIINSLWLDKLKKSPELYTIHNLYDEYPNFDIDIIREQSLVENHDNIIFQFPIYWFSCPPLLKQWFDSVLTYGWAYGSSSGYRLQGKKIGLAVTAGIQQKDYTKSGRYYYTLTELLRPFEVTVNYIRATWIEPFCFYGMESSPDKNLIPITEKEIEKGCSDYIKFLGRNGASG